MKGMFGINHRSPLQASLFNYFMNPDLRKLQSGLRQGSPLGLMRDPVV